MANLVDSTAIVAPTENHTQHADLVSTLTGWQQLLLIIGVVVLIIVVGKYFIRYLFRFIASTGLREIFTASALLLVIALALAMNYVGLSPALGAFLGGVVLADSEYRRELETDIEPFKGLLLGLFFISVGASINFNILFNRPGQVLLLLGILLAAKFVDLLFLGKRFKLQSGQEYLFAFSLAQAGEFGFVLISFSVQNSIFSKDLAGLLLIVVALSMLVTPLLLIFNEKLVQALFIKKENKPEADEIDEKENPVIIAGFGRFGLVIGRFLKANGIGTTVLDNNPDNIKTLRKFGFKVFYGDASRTDLLEKAGVGNAKIFVLAIDDPDISIEMIKYLQKNYPDLKIYSRAIDIKHTYKLLNHKVNGLRRETYDSSLELGKMVLKNLGFSGYQTQRAANTFKYHDEEVIKELFKLWQKDKKLYIKEAKRFTEELESILLAEHENSIHESDSAWDNSTLREEIKERYPEIKDIYE